MCASVFERPHQKKGEVVDWKEQSKMCVCCAAAVGCVGGADFDEYTVSPSFCNHSYNYHQRRHHHNLYHHHYVSYNLPVVTFLVCTCMLSTLFFHKKQINK